MPLCANNRITSSTKNRFEIRWKLRCVDASSCWNNTWWCDIFVTSVKLFSVDPRKRQPGWCFSRAAHTSKEKRKSERPWAVTKDLSRAMTALHFNTNLTLINWHDVEMLTVASTPGMSYWSFWKAFCDSIPVVIYKVNNIYIRR